MNKKENARPAVAAVGQASGTDYAGQYSHTHFSDILNESQERVVSLIGIGQDAAVPRMRLAEMAGLDERAVRALIQQARLQRVPIISGNSGYFLSDNSNEVRRFARSMERRGKAIQTVGFTMLQTADQMDGQEAFDDWWEDDGGEMG